MGEEGGRTPGTSVPSKLRPQLQTEKGELRLSSCGAPVPSARRSEPSGDPDLDDSEGPGGCCQERLIPTTHSENPRTRFGKE